jgi:hypothetical protein
LAVEEEGTQVLDWQICEDGLTVNEI